MSDAAPAHLKADTTAWFLEVVAEYELTSAHLRLLTLACEAYDRGRGAREQLAIDGTTYLDRFGSPKIHPLVAVERDSGIRFARLMRELALTDEPDDAPRPPRTGGRS